MVIQPRRTTERMRRHETAKHPQRVGAKLTPALLSTWDVPGRGVLPSGWCSPCWAQPWLTKQTSREGCNFWTGRGLTRGNFRSWDLSQTCNRYKVGHGPISKEGFDQKSHRWQVGVFPPPRKRSVPPTPGRHPGARLMGNSPCCLLHRASQDPTGTWAGLGCLPYASPTLDPSA